MEWQACSRCPIVAPAPVSSGRSVRFCLWRGLLVASEFVRGAPLFSGYNIEHWNVPVDSLLHVEECTCGDLCGHELWWISDRGHQLLRPRRSWVEKLVGVVVPSWSENCLCCFVIGSDELKWWWRHTLSLLDRSCSFFEEGNLNLLDSPSEAARRDWRFRRSR